MPVTHVFAGVAVTDIGAARAWYERLIGRPPDTLPNENEALWNLTGTGLIYIVGDAGRAGQSVLTLAVDDLPGQAAALAGRGIRTSPVEEQPGLYRKTTVTDPDGNLISLFDVPGSAGG